MYIIVTSSIASSARKRDAKLSRNAKRIQSVFTLLPHFVFDTSSLHMFRMHRTIPRRKSAVILLALSCNSFSRRGSATTESLISAVVTGEVFEVVGRNAACVRCKFDISVLTLMKRHLYPKLWLIISDGYRRVKPCKPREYPATFDSRCMHDNTVFCVFPFSDDKRQLFADDGLRPCADFCDSIHGLFAGCARVRGVCVCVSLGLGAI